MSLCYFSITFILKISFLHFDGTLHICYELYQYQTYVKVYDFSIVDMKVSQWLAFGVKSFLLKVHFLFPLWLGMYAYIFFTFMARTSLCY